MEGVLSLPESVSNTAFKMGCPDFPRLLQEQKHLEMVDNTGDSTFFIPKDLFYNLPNMTKNTIELSDIIAYVFATAGWRQDYWN